MVSEGWFGDRATKKWTVTLWIDGKKEGSHRVASKEEALADKQEYEDQGYVVSIHDPQGFLY